MAKTIFITFAVKNQSNLNDMKRLLRVWMTMVLMAIIGIANAQGTQWYGYARTCFNGESWQNQFITFNTQNPDEVQSVSVTLPELWAATYLDGYVWFVTMTRSLCKAPFDEATQTIGAYETVVPALEQYNLYVDMAYNPQDGMMYYLCQDSQYNSFLKRSSLATPSEVEVVGGFSEKLWTLAINSQGRAYGVAYEGGNLYEINLNDATTTLVGPTGKEVWYTQSMAFDLDTDELYWAQFATASDHGLYQVDTETGMATSLGEIGLGTQLTGLFMVPQPTPQEPEVINEIYVEGFTVPAYGEHPDFDVTLASDAHCVIEERRWVWSCDGSIVDLAEEDVFDQEDGVYYMGILFSPEEGYVFAEEMTVYFDGDASFLDTQNSIVYPATGQFQAWTINFTVTDPAGIPEQTTRSLAVWPNPAGNMLQLDVKEGETVTVFDMTGRMVLQERYSGKLDVSRLVSGVYAVKAEGRMVKFVKE